jgi:structural maintenance of chromosome 2
MNCKRHEELIRKRQIIQQNKEQLELAITVLDVERQKDVKRTIGQVDKHFNDIFSALLPGTGAHLHQIYEDDNPSQLKGLRLGVSFNGVEKASLTELSGGQRSLLALSLILALLKFQPAPFYILDEIDSALDLSHTQNIG